MLRDYSPPVKEISSNTADLTNVSGYVQSTNSPVIGLIADSLLSEGTFTRIQSCDYQIALIPLIDNYLDNIDALMPDLILLDTSLQNRASSGGLGSAKSVETSDALAVCHQLKNHESTLDIPVIFITNLDIAPSALIISAFKAGGVDYLNQAMSVEELKARIDTHLNLKYKLRQQAKEREFQSFADGIPDLIIRYDLNCRRTYVNRAHAELYGLEKNQVLGINPSQDWLPSASITAERYLDKLQRVMTSGEITEIAYNHVTDNGETIFYSTSLAPDINEAGQIIGVIAIARNVTPLKQMWNLLLKSEKEFRTLAENSPELIIRYDLALQRTYINPAYDRFAGILTPVKWDNKPKQAGNPLIKSVDYFACLQKVLETGESKHFSLEWHEQNGNLLSHDMHIVAEHGEKGEIIGLLVMGHNVTALNLSEKHLKESRAELRMLTIKREEAREQERKRIAREIHDELGQLLSVMRLSTSTLDLRFGDANPDLHEVTTKIIATVDHAILVARCLATRLRPAILNAGIVYALEWMIEDYTESSDVNFVLHIPARDFALEDDRAVMAFRIVQESLTNVVRHSGASRVDVSLQQIDNDYELEVSDNGRGYDLHKPAKRHSYGLVGMKERAMILGGKLSFFSEIGKGTTIKLRFPIVKPSKEIVFDEDD